MFRFRFNSAYRLAGGNELRYFTRSYASGEGASESTKSKNTNVALLLGSAVVGMVGLSYLSVPLYRLFCKITGYGGTIQLEDDTNAGIVDAKRKAKEKDLHPIRVTFNADVAPNIAWSFRPVQKEVTVLPGETALAFFSAENKSDKGVTGVSTYNVTPNQAGLYFNKIQCFCFEHQRLNAHEQVDMPVFFYIDPDIMDDKLLKDVRNITLSYTFFLVDEETGETDAPQEWFEEQERILAFQEQKRIEREEQEVQNMKG